MRLLACALAGAALLSACSPVYVARASWAQIGILRSRVPFEEVLADSTTPPETRRKLELVTAARAFAVEELGLRDTGRSYTTLAPLESDTLALVLSAAYRDRLAYRTWWFPVIGRVPYRGYFSLEEAERARDELEREGYDTYLRPTVAFSTLGWFADPLYSTLLRLDEVALVETVLHELAHAHLYVPGQGVFNESFANFAGYAGSIEFFCRERPDPVECDRARARWEDAQAISRYLDDLEERARELYARAAAGGAAGGRGGATGAGAAGTAADTLDLMAERERLFSEAQERFVREVQPTLRASTYSYLATEPLNNATLLARSLYYRRLTEFEGLRARFPGDLPRLLAWFRAEARGRPDPFSLLAETPTPAEVEAVWSRALAEMRAPPPRSLAPLPSGPVRRRR